MPKQPHGYAWTGHGAHTAGHNEKMQIFLTLFLYWHLRSIIFQIHHLSCSFHGPVVPIYRLAGTSNFMQSLFVVHEKRFKWFVASVQENEARTHRWVSGPQQSPGIWNPSCFIVVSVFSGLTWTSLTDPVDLFGNYLFYKTSSLLDDIFFHSKNCWRRGDTWDFRDDLKDTIIYCYINARGKNDIIVDCKLPWLWK